MREWAAARGVPADEAALREDPAFLAAIRAAIDRVSADLSVIEKVRRFAFADEPFSIENSELTPSMKIRRHAIRARYQARLDALY
jgi:long-chain acyl-CoA synthetase